jgi:trans-2,3-dihydro-3-hydroxyanthranilate isomerase
MQRRFAIIDVFTDKGAGGNPLAVVLDAEGLSERQMQIIAKGFGFSETTFVLKPADPANTARVRIFTPTYEMPFAGHPNVGTALVLAKRADRPLTSLVFEEIAGLVPITVSTAAGRPATAEVTAPQPFVRGANSDPGKIAAMLGISAAEVLVGSHRPTMASVGAPFLFAELDSRESLRQATPDRSKLVALLRMTETHGLYVYTKDGSDPDHDIHARMFSRDDTILEDPATGSAAVALVGLLATLSPMERIELTLRIGQGADMGRPSLLVARALKRAGKLVSAHVGGAGVEKKQGTFPLAGEL